MTLTERLREVVNLLKERSVRFALAGGLVASLYRRQERFTKDLDFLFMTQGDSFAAASDILRKLGLDPKPVRKAQLQGGPKHELKRTTGPVWMVIGVRSEPSDLVGVGFILSPMPWFELSLQRAEENLIDFGFDKLPCLTVEDLILSKFYALSNRSDRFSDLDDIQDIFLSDLKLDLNYLSDRMNELNLTVPRAIEPKAPAILIKVSKLIRGRRSGSSRD